MSSQPGLQSEFQVSEGYSVRPCLKKTNIQTNNPEKKQQTNKQTNKQKPKQLKTLAVLPERLALVIGTGIARDHLKPVVGSPVFFSIVIYIYGEQKYMQAKYQI